MVFSSPVSQQGKFCGCHILHFILEKTQVFYQTQQLEFQIRLYLFESNTIYVPDTAKGINIPGLILCIRKDWITYVDMQDGDSMERFKSNPEVLDL